MEELEQYTKEELTIHAGKAQVAAIGYALPFLLLFAGVYMLIWKSELDTWKDIVKMKGLLGASSGLMVLFVGIVLHELIHGITWACYAKRGFRSIRFGVIWKYLTPYCHCNEPMRVKHYIIGGIMPAIVLGFLPCIVAIITGSPAWMGFGLFFTLAAGGDFMIVNLLRKQPLDYLVQDHPDKLGCYIYKPQ